MHVLFIINNTKLQYHHSIKTLGYSQLYSAGRILHYPYNLIKSVAYQTFILVKSSICSLKQKATTKNKANAKHKTQKSEHCII